MKTILKNSIKEILGYAYFNLYKKYMNNFGNKTLIYHAFGLKLKHDTYGISIDINRFKSHMIYIKNNYMTHALDKPLSRYSNSVSITIDDGYKDTLDAVDILQNLKIPFTLFLTSDFINKDTYLSSNDIKDISLLEYSNIGSHGKTHLKLGLLDTQQQRSELTESQNYIESIINSKVKLISFPHGSYNETTLSLLNELGYNLAATSKKGFNTDITDKYSLYRSEIISSDSTNQLKKKIEGFYDFY